MLRCWVTDKDVRAIRADISNMLWSSIDIVPSSGEGVGGVISDLNTGTTEGTLTYETGGFTELAVGTLVNIAGLGIYQVKSVTSATAIVIETDSNRRGMSTVLVAASGYRFCVGGHTDKILRAYNEIYDRCGMTRYIYLDDDPLNMTREVGQLISKALYVPDDWHGADLVISMGALKWILFDNFRNEESSLFDVYQAVAEEYDDLLSALQMQYDYDESGTAETEESMGQTLTYR